MGPTPRASSASDPLGSEPSHDKEDDDDDQDDADDCDAPMTSAVAAEAANQKNEAAFANTSFDSNEKGNDDLSKIAQNRC